MIALQDGAKLRAIARRLGRSPSTISREIRRGRVEPAQVCIPALPPAGAYLATEAARQYRQRRMRRSVRRRKLEPGTGLYERVRALLLYRYWSPQQIATCITPTF